MTCGECKEKNGCPFYENDDDIECIYDVLADMAKRKSEKDQKKC